MFVVVVYMLFTATIRKSGKAKEMYMKTVSAAKTQASFVSFSCHHEKILSHTLLLYRREISRIQHCPYTDPVGNFTSAHRK